VDRSDRSPPPATSPGPQAAPSRQPCAPTSSPTARHCRRGGPPPQAGRRKRSEGARHPLDLKAADPAKAALAAAEPADRLGQHAPGKLGPGHRGEIVLGIDRLPEQEVRDPKL